MALETYKCKIANQPSFNIGKMASNFNGEWQFTGVIDETIKFIEDMQMLNPELWFRFVQQFRLHTDTDNGWRGEFWGKMMRGACFIYSYVINFADRVLDSDFTVIGCSGCTHELFDHSTVRQANTTNGKIMQETCVTVTLMKFFYQLTLLTGNPKYVDAFERSLYNAYLGAVNTEQRIEASIEKKYPKLHLQPLPFDSYSPLTAGTRGNGIGGFKIMPDNHYYGCCAGNGLSEKRKN